MSKTEFEASLRSYLDRLPFEPFVVELTDGRRLVIKQPPVAFCDGGAGFVDLAQEALVDFSYEQVATFGRWEQRVPA